LAPPYTFHQPETFKNFPHPTINEKQILERQNGMVWAGSIWLRIIEHNALPNWKWYYRMNSLCYAMTERWANIQGCFWAVAW
jgi:hypothetical protein